MSKKVMFLFGAGADASYDIGVGASFSIPLITSQYKKEIDNIFGWKKSSSYSLIHSNSRTVFLQTIFNHREKAVDVFDPSIVDFLYLYYKSTDKNTKELQDKSTIAKTEILNLDKEIKLVYGKKDSDKSTKKEKRTESPSDFIGIFCHSIYVLLCNYNNNVNTDFEKANKIFDFFTQNASFFDTLDEKFNSLRYDNDNRALRVQNAYWTAFLIIFKSLYLKNNRRIIAGKEFTFTLDKIFHTIIKTENCKYSLWKCDNDTYYSLIRDLSKENYYITTTNYTSIAEKETKNNDVIYLHGKMNWFEDYKKLSVYDIIDEQRKGKLEDLIKKKEALIPFILIPSGVKPLICKRQILEFSKFVNNLDKCDLLVVVGYRYNSEDNHINSIIADWLREDENKMILLNYSSDNRYMDLEKINWLSEFTKNKNCTDEEILTSKEKIINLEVNGSNSIDRFKRLIETLF